MGIGMAALLLLCILGLLYMLGQVVRAVVLGPWLIRRAFEKQGDLYVFWMGFRAALTLRSPEHIKDVLSNKSGHFHKVILRPETRDLLGESVVFLEGEKWAQHRRIVSGAFYAEKVKGMTPAMVACISGQLDKWQSQLDALDSKEIDVCEQFKVLAADIIAHAAFGSSYVEGKAVLKLQQEQQQLVINLGLSLYIPGSRFLPTAHNRRSWK
ncbi:hypothetical protein GOP47_0025494 [Adiantum capillus-veneris]|uniref:Cytochrome P450 n=1 Tax=Adiantum capillus-veneris TaxID=13818 RepID=A0A9D4U1I8_ADICA|nr:hypothetical protein GOP47_0025494 [Adiantum capillus-veneris]